MSDQCCSTCKWHLTEDRGYSNYTVTESFACCILNADDRYPCAMWSDYRQDSNETGEWGTECTQYELGSSVHLDVDRDEADSELEKLDEDVKARLMLMGIIIENLGYRPNHDSPHQFIWSAVEGIAEFYGKEFEY